MARGVWSCLPPLSPHKTQNRPSPPPLLPPSRRDILGLQLSAAHACIRQTHSREETNNEQYSNKSRGYGECGQNAHRMRRGPRAPIQVACFFHYTRLLRAPSWAAKINERTSPQDGRISLHPFGESFFHLGGAVMGARSLSAT
jgi:hypothetical protein